MEKTIEFLKFKTIMFKLGYNSFEQEEKKKLDEGDSKIKNVNVFERLKHEYVGGASIAKGGSVVVLAILL